MYPFVLVTHSWLRWLVLGLGLALLATGARAWRSDRAWGRAEDRLRVAFLGVLDVQVLLGLVMYVWLSPLSAAGTSDIPAALADPVLRFYTVEHPFGMVVGLFGAHFGLGRWFPSDPARRPRAVVLTQIAWLLITVSSVPWPGLQYGRPFFRS